MGIKNKRVFAIYLPQFHPFPENDSFWGRGFTEWRNVASAKPQFKGHPQPYIPSELGFYDLRLPKILEQQVELASDYGIDGFMFYHYWFQGKVIMDTPLHAYKNLEKKLPYFFCWANENWTRRWDGHNDDVLLEQKYSRSDDEQHFQYLLPFFDDKDYLRINGCPVISLYRPSEVPDIHQWAMNMKRMAEAAGLPGIYLINVKNLGNNETARYSTMGFDASLIFQPSWTGEHPGALKASFADKVGKLLFLLKLKKTIPVVYRHTLIDYPRHVEMSISRKAVESRSYPSVCPMWDNSARRKNSGATIFINSNPGIFKKWFYNVYHSFQPFSAEENLVFINAWNEWAEGNFLEPSLQWQRQYLEAVKSVVQSASVAKTDEHLAGAMKSLEF